MGNIHRRKQGYIVDVDGHKHVISDTIRNYLIYKGVEVVQAHRINDMTNWTDRIVDLDKLASSLYLTKQEGHNIVVDLVQN